MFSEVELRELEDNTYFHPGEDAMFIGNGVIKLVVDEEDLTYIEDFMEETNG